ncbi:glycosyl transferase family 2 [Desulfosarcina widdelii]|uniref:Glycosyl transferase family 2 n=1 Tax=Desulfosarcina widdelii TaxID=947919 RepID=A0A5K7Z6P8_9BACT|nr:glycosyltransferase family 2 protein [Desulfosarcina widdelii]BBO77682.1 glycosyl transferase family 2 [Desulfosarcina widdelii]
MEAIEKNQSSLSVSDMSIMDRPLVSIVLPAFNEKETIAIMVDSLIVELRKAAFNFEIIIVDDGSTDDTFEVSKKLSSRYPFVKAIRFSRNFGKEAALLVGLKAASGEAIVSMDSDLQHPPAIIHELFKKWQEGYKVIHAVKENRDADSILQRGRASVFNLIFNWLGGINLCNSSDFMLIDRCAANVIVKTIGEKERFHRGLAHWIGFNQTTIPFRVQKRHDGSKSRFKFKALVKLALVGIISFTSVPLHLISISGLMVLVVGLVIALDAIASWAHGTTFSGYATLIMVMLIIGGFTIFSLGIIGEYIAKIYEEVKNRPVYIIESTVGVEQRWNL